MMRLAGLAWALLGIGATAAAAAPDWIDVRGYRVDTSRVPEAQLAETLANLEHQMGIIESANLPAKVATFFRQIPIAIDPALTGMNGAYDKRDGKWLVRARPGQWPSDRAILLHEMLHAYHREVLKMPTPPIGEAYTEARRKGVYPADWRNAYFLSNAREYFAVVGEIYIIGPSFRPPFNCAAVQKVQPQFIRWLSTFLGERECR
jgi:hypothetical protein